MDFNQNQKPSTNKENPGGFDLRGFLLVACGEGGTVSRTPFLPYESTTCSHHWKSKVPRWVYQLKNETGCKIWGLARVWSLEVPQLRANHFFMIDPVSRPQGRDQPI